MLERYQVTTHKDSGIRNDPNDWAAEVGNPRYMLDLLLSVIRLSVETVEIVRGLLGVGVCGRTKLLILKKIKSFKFVASSIFCASNHEERKHVTGTKHGIAFGAYCRAYHWRAAAGIPRHQCGYSEPNLRNFRQFYLHYPIRYAARSELTWHRLLDQP